MDDEGGFSFDDIEEDTAVTTQESAAPAAAADSGAPAATTVVEEASAEDHLPPPEDDGYRKPLVLYKHWVRPKFLQYNYMYDYRHNYYDDVIDYLDQRQKGLNREIPRAQSWAERVLRTNNSKPSLSAFTLQIKEDRKLAASLSASIRSHNYHTKAYINRKYSSIL